MTQLTQAALLQRLLVGYLANARAELGETGFEQVRDKLTAYLPMAREMMPPETLADRSLMRQAIHALAAGQSLEATLMHSFMLHVYLLTHHSTGHPLEMGIIRQTILGALPLFEQARDQGCISDEMYESNAALLMSIADKTEDIAAALDLLAGGYARYR